MNDTKLSAIAQQTFKPLIFALEEFQTHRLTEQVAYLVDDLISTEDLCPQTASFLFKNFCDNLRFKNEDDGLLAYEIGWNDFVNGLEHWLILASRVEGKSNTSEARKEHIENIAIKEKMQSWLDSSTKALKKAKQALASEAYPVVA